MRFCPVTTLVWRLSALLLLFGYCCGRWLTNSCTRKRQSSACSPRWREFGAKPRVIAPPFPSVTTSSEPLMAPRPLGGPSTTSGKFARPKSGPGPATNDSTLVAKRDVQLGLPSGAVASAAHAEAENPTKRSAPSVRPHELTNVDSRASSRSVVDGAEATCVAPAHLQTGLPTSLSSLRHLREVGFFRPSLVSLARRYSGYGGGSVPDFHRTSQGGITTSPRGAQQAGAGVTRRARPCNPD